MHRDDFDRLNDRLSENFTHIVKCTAECAKYGKVFLASPPDKRYPYVYPRDVASAVQLFRRLAGSKKGYDIGPQAFELIENMANFMKDVQSTRGSWGQRYGLEGEDMSVYKQEDNTAHGISIISNYLLTARRLRKDVEDLESYLVSLDRALNYALNHDYHKEINLFYSTTSIHESAMEKGFTCWVNFAYLYAFNRASEVAALFDDREIISKENLGFNDHFNYVINQIFMAGDRYIRRIDPHGNMDMRPDFTLLSPFYFGYITYRDEMAKSVQFLEKQLCDPQLNMIMRYLPFYNDLAVHVHAGNGPWLQYTAILAQYHFWTGNHERGDFLLQTIDRYKNEKGEIPEHLSTCKRFEAFLKNEWQSGLDFQKEFHKDILLSDVEFDKILEETNNMSLSYQETGKKCMFPDGKSAEGGFIQFATPLLWSHVEYSRALLFSVRDWWKID